MGYEKPRVDGDENVMPVGVHKLRTTRKNLLLRYQDPIFPGILHADLVQMFLYSLFLRSVTYAEMGASILQRPAQRSMFASSKASPIVRAPSAPIRLWKRTQFCQFFVR
jgi:hypothetical protein